MAAFTAPDPTDRTAFDEHWQRIRRRPAVCIRTIVAGDEVAGHIASFDREGDREVTYWIDRAFWGRGIATDALRAFLEVEPVRPLTARAAADNAASVRVLEKCGFVERARELGYAEARHREIEEVVLVRDQ